jgi:hypothetical protein
MSIYAALGHQIVVLTKRNEIAKEAIEDLLSKLNVLFQEDPSAREKYSLLAESARKALKAVVSG